MSTDARLLDAARAVVEAYRRRFANPLRKMAGPIDPEIERLRDALDGTEKKKAAGEHPYGVGD